MRPISSLQDDASAGGRSLQLTALPTSASSMSRSRWSMAAIRDRICLSLLGSKRQISAPAKPATAMSADVLRVHLTFLLLLPVAGKRTARLSASVTDEVAEAFTKFSRERGYESVSQCLEELVLTSLYGEEAVVSFHADRVRALFQRRTSTDPKVNQ